MSPRNYKTAFTKVLYKVMGYSMVLLCFVLICGLFLTQNQKSKSDLSGQVATMSAPLNPSAKAWGIFDPTTGQVLKGVNTNERHAIASVTKLFVAESVLRSSRKGETFTISSSDLETEGRAGKLEYGEKVTPYALLFPLLIESSNDAGEAIRRFLGEEFDDSLKNIESSLSLNDTYIFDASGLSSQNVSTVHDLAILYSYVRNTHPHILDITQLRTYIGPHTGYVNNDPARTFPNFAGGKHGYTPEAGRTFVGSFTLPDSQKEIGIILLGSDNLTSDIEKILTYRNSKEASDIMTQ